MNIGDKVVTKRTGFPACGVIRSFFEPGVFEDFIGRFYELNEYSFVVWDELYPDWREKRVVKVAFDEPILPIRFDEFLKIKPNYTFEEARIYHQHLFRLSLLCYPIDDLEAL